MYRKFILLLTILILFVTPLPVSGQEQSNIESTYETAISSQNINYLSKNMSSTVELTTPEQKGSFSNQQARLILKKFFEKHPVKSFKISRNGDFPDKSRFYIGELIDKKGNSYRVYFVLKKSSGKWKVHILHFNKK